MDRIETNLYSIENLSELNCKYRVYRVRGLSRGSEDYHKDAQLLIDKLSRKTRSPCVKFTEGDKVYIAQPEGFEKLPDSFDLVRKAVKIEKKPKLRRLKFDSLNRTEANFARRFLQFSLQIQLSQKPNLWQPQSGYPFFNKKPDKRAREMSDEVDMLRGFAFRVVPLSDGRMGICVDVCNKYVSHDPLPTDISPEEFKKYKGSKCLYEYGDTWYEIRIQGFNDLNVSEVKLPGGDSLFDHIHKKARPPKSKALQSLPKDCSVLTYYNFKGESRNVPSGLCRLTYSTDQPEIKMIHQRAIKPPTIRREKIQFVVDNYLKDLRFGPVKINLSKKPLSIDENLFYLPDLEFGNEKVLSTRKSSNSSIPTSFHNFPKSKKQLLYSDNAGIFIKKPFDRQYLILPNSVWDSFGEKFQEHLRKEVQRYFPRNDEVKYSPIVIPYNDSVRKSIPKLGQEILKAIERSDVKAGFSVVMIPELTSKGNDEDELANLVMNELRKRGIYSSIIHTKVPTASYEYSSEGDNGHWKITSQGRQRRKFKGYLQNVALNKVLLLNSFWPFVLNTPLNADLTIGIDVKNNTAGFSLIYQTGGKIRFESSDSNQKEKLGENHMKTKIAEILREDQEEILSRDIKKIVIHRQGILFPSEKEGVIEALDRLADEGLITNEYQCTFVEIRSTSKIPLRLFQIKDSNHTQEEIVRNPKVGVHISQLLQGEEGFICNTGYPYRHKGTTNPLYIIKVEGPMPMDSILEDVFYLANLTWTKVDDCSRQPLSIKMADIRLREIAGEYDEDALAFKKKGG